jgi:ACS family sodium-dependent inorganic phosphate cotransporter
MLATGMFADRLNGKWMVSASIVLCVAANLAIPLFAPRSFWYAVVARLCVGASDACLLPSVNSLITRWFPQSERAAAIGFITGGRQMGMIIFEYIYRIMFLSRYIIYIANSWLFMHT